MSADNYLYVDRKGLRYVIVQRFTSDDYPDSIRAGEFIMADSTEPSSAVLMASRMQHEHPTEHGVLVSGRVAKELGWHGPGGV